MYQTSCLCSIGFFNRSDEGSRTSFRDQSQRVIHLYATLQMCFTQRLHCYQGSMTPFLFVLVHQRVRNRTDETHVEHNPEDKMDKSDACNDTMQTQVNKLTNSARTQQNTG